MAEPDTEGSCYFCEKKTDAENFCYVCREHICDDCATAENQPWGDHAPEDHQ